MKGIIYCYTNLINDKKLLFNILQNTNMLILLIVLQKHYDFQAKTLNNLVLLLNVVKKYINLLLAISGSMYKNNMKKNKQCSIGARNRNRGQGYERRLVNKLKKKI